MNLQDIEERLREMIDAHSEDERGEIVDPDGLVDKLYALEQELIRARLLGAS